MKASLPLEQAFRTTGLLALFAGASLLFTVWMVLLSIALPEWWEPGHRGSRLATDLIMVGIYASLGAAATVQFVRRKQSFRSLIPRQEPPTMKATTATMLTIAVFVGSVTVAVADAGMREAWLPAWVETNEPIATSPLTWFMAVLLAPPVEELLFRGYLLHRWGRWGPRVGLVATSALFALLHPNPVGHFLFAMTVGHVVLRTQTLSWAIAIHAGNNVLALLVGSLAPAEVGAPSTMNLSTEELTVAMVLAACVVFAFAWGFRRWGGTPPFRPFLIQKTQETLPMLNVITLDLEGVLVPEIWIEFSEITKIPELRLTTRDVPDYDVLMNKRIGILKEHGLKLKDIQNVIRKMEPMEGAKAFLDGLRAQTQVVILSDTFTQFAGPLMEKLGMPTIFCNTLVVNEAGDVTGYRLRQKDGKRIAVQGFHSMGLKVFAAGDSYNDTGMLQEADAGFFFCPPDSIVGQFPKIPVTKNYQELGARFAECLKG